MQGRELQNILVCRDLFANTIARVVRHLALCLVAGLFFATAPFNTALAAQEYDPFVSVNRPVHEFNKVVDSALFKPLARVYQKFTPRLIRKGIRNFFSNIDDVQVTLNDILQLDFKKAGSDFSRLAINSTLGLGGVLNVSGDVFGLEKHDQDFGQTLAHWGVAKGPYIVLPLLGPSTVRESVSLIAGYTLNPIRMEGAGTRDKAVSVAGIDARASFLSFDELIFGDEYLFLRGMYLQNLEYRNTDNRIEVSLSDF